MAGGVSSLQRGDNLGPYRIVSPLGSGGMGEVYRAKDTRLDREVAVKVLPRSFMENPERESRFEREAKALAALSHPHILSIHDFGREGTTAYFVTELLEGMTLREKLMAGPIPVRFAMHIAIEMSEGLAAAHSRGIVHRDLKPANVFLTQDGHVKILDFGLARTGAPAASPAESPSESPTVDSPTRPGTMMGTVGYMAPEVVRGNAADQRADLFSLGVIFYEMISGRSPFHGPSDADTLVAILSMEPAPLTSAEGPVSPIVEGVIFRCLQKEPGARFSSARDVAFALEGVASGVSGPALKVPSRSILRPGALLAAALLILAAAAAAGLWLKITNGSGEIPPFESRQITTRPGLEGDPAISPDGRSVAFLAQNGEGWDIWIVDVKGGSPLRLVADGAVNASPAWFPDGSALAFACYTGQSSNIWKVPRFGGAPIFLVPEALDPAVSPDGRRIAFARSERGGYSRIWAADIGAPRSARRLTGDSDGVWNHLRPSWSPDGRTICYQDNNDLWVVPAEGGKARNLTSDDAADSNPVWSPDGKHIYFDSLREEGYSIWRMKAGGNGLQRVTIGTGAERKPSLSLDGRCLAYCTTGRMSCSIVNRRTGERAVFSSGTFTSEPSFAPDGLSLVFTMLRDGNINLWRARLKDGKVDGDAEPLTEHRGYCANPTISPDGRWVAYHRVSNGERDIWVVPAGGGAPVNFTEHKASDTQPEWSPDGGEISFVSDRSGRDEVWAAKFRAGRRVGDPRQVTRGPGTIATHCWTPSGERIAYISNSEAGSDIWTVLANGQGSSSRLTEGAGATFVTDDPFTGGLLVMGTWGGKRCTVKRVDVRDGKTSPVPHTDPQPPTAETLMIEVSRDGKQLALLESENEGDIWMLEAKKKSF